MSKAQDNANTTTSWSHVRRSWSSPFKQAAGDRHSDAFYREQQRQDEAREQWEQQVAAKDADIRGVPFA